VKRAFTLIELLVVIAIIAILAAILFPVFAQAKVAAKKTADLSNNKQINLSTQIYLNDSDDLYPLQSGAISTTGQWGYAQGQMLIPYNWSTEPATANQYQFSMGMANNTIQPYAKNYPILGSPGGTTDPYGPGGAVAPAGYLPGTFTYTYNGLMTGYSSTSMATPATVPIWWAGMGNGAFKGWSLANPQIDCPQAGQPCVYVPNNGACSGAVNGQQGLMYGTPLTFWLFTNGHNWAYGDGHAKFRKIGVSNAGNNWTTEPFVSYNAYGVEGGSYWWDGCHAWLFRPEYSQ
jgi:prepilin-type N-terminal cleavage/methylation domain-containing protein